MDWPSDTHPREPGNGELYYMPPLDLLLRLPQVSLARLRVRARALSLVTTGNKLLLLCSCACRRCAGGAEVWGCGCNGGWNCWKS